MIELMKALVISYKGGLQKCILQQLSSDYICTEPSIKKTQSFLTFEIGRALAYTLGDLSWSCQVTKWYVCTLLNHRRRNLARTYKDQNRSTMGLAITQLWGTSFLTGRQWVLPKVDSSRFKSVQWYSLIHSFNKCWFLKIF